MFIFFWWSFRKFHFFRKVGNNLLSGDYIFSLKKSASEEAFLLLCRSFLSGNFIPISLKNLRCSKYLRGLRSWAKRWTKKQMRASVCLTKNPSFFSCNRPLWKFLLRHEFVQCISGRWSNCLFLRCDWSCGIKPNQNETRRKSKHQMASKVLHPFFLK